MDPDDPLRTPTLLVQLAREDLDPLSVAECAARITALETEITRTRTRMSVASDHRATADQLFKR